MATNARQRWSSLLLLLLLLLSSRLVSSTETKSITSLVSQVPNCALSCIMDGFQKGGCKLASVKVVTDCLCPNIDLQADMSKCVQKSCFFNDQIRAAALQTDLCADYPKESRTREARDVAIALSVVTFPIVGLRCVSRWLVTRHLWWDDWMVIVATVLLAVMAGVQIAGAQLGLGLHYWNVEPSNGVVLIQLFWAGQQLYILVQLFAKVSILLLFSRVFSASRWLQLAVRGFIAFLVVHGVVYLFLVIFECVPVSSIWDLSNPDRRCKDIGAIAYSGAVFSIVEDIVILLLPIPELVKLQLSNKKKAGLGLLFSLGSFACITSAVRLKYLQSFSSTFDVTWDNVDIVIWSLVEVFCAILCASLPALRPLFMSLKKRATKKDSEAAPLRRLTLNYRKKNFCEISTATDPVTEVSISSPIDDTKIGDEIAKALHWWDKVDRWSINTLGIRS